MKQKADKKDKKVEKAVKKFADQFIKEGDYPEKPSDIEIKPYKNIDRDVL